MKRPVVDVKRSVHDVLLEVLRNIDVHGPLCANTGICANIGEELSAADEEWMYRQDLECIVTEFLDIACKWSRFSGLYSYPVPGPADSPCAFSYFVDVGYRIGFWVGEYGQNRKDLLKFVIEYLEKSK